MMCKNVGEQLGMLHMDFMVCMRSLSRTFRSRFENKAT